MSFQFLGISAEAYRFDVHQLNFVLTGERSLDPLSTAILLRKAVKSIGDHGSTFEKTNNVLRDILKIREPRFQIALTQLKNLPSLLVDWVFIKTGQELLPCQKRVVEEVSAIFKRNVLAKELLVTNPQKIFEDAIEALNQTKLLIIANLTQTGHDLNQHDIDSLRNHSDCFAEAVQSGAIVKRDVEVEILYDEDCVRGSLKNLSASLRRLQKPKDISEEAYEMLLETLTSIKKQKEHLKAIKDRIAGGLGFGIVPKKTQEQITEQKNH